MNSENTYTQQTKDIIVDFMLLKSEDQLIVWDTINAMRKNIAGANALMVQKKKNNI